MGTFQHNLQTDMENSTSYYPKGIGGANLNVQPYLISSLRKRGAIPPLAVTSLWRNTCLSTEIILYLRFMNVLLQFIESRVTGAYRRSRQFSDRKTDQITELPSYTLTIPNGSPLIDRFFN